MAACFLTTNPAWLLGPSCHPSSCLSAPPVTRPAKLDSSPFSGHPSPFPISLPVVYWAWRVHLLLFLSLSSLPHLSFSYPTISGVYFSCLILRCSRSFQQEAFPFGILLGLLVHPSLSRIVTLLGAGLGPLPPRPRLGGF